MIIDRYEICINDNRLDCADTLRMAKIIAKVVASDLSVDLNIIRIYDCEEKKWIYSSFSD